MAGSGGSISVPVQLEQPAEQLQRALDVGRDRRILLVLDRLDLGGLERAAGGQLEHPEALPPLDDDVQAAVVEALEHLGDRRPGADVAQPVVVGEDEPELALLVEALADQLAVARLEDVQRHQLGREQDDPEREEPDLAHPGVG